MHTDKSTAALDDCTGPLAERDRLALRRYWERVIWEEWVPPSEREPRAVLVAGEVRRRREARRAVARIAAAGRMAPVVSLPASTPAAAGSGVAA